MPSLFETDFVFSAVPDLFAQFGEDATYTTEAGAATSVTAIKHDMGDEKQAQHDGYGKAWKVQVQIRESEITSAAVDDSVTIGSDEWKVESIALDNGVWLLECESYASIEHSGKSGRQNRPNMSEGF